METSVRHTEALGWMLTDLGIWLEGRWTPHRGRNRWFNQRNLQSQDEAAGAVTPLYLPPAQVVHEPWTSLFIDVGFSGLLIDVLSEEPSIYSPEVFCREGASWFRKETH